MRRSVSYLLSAIAAAALSAFVPATAASAQSATYHYTTVDGINIFYREAGDPKKPTVVLLHGFPSSSHMFRDLIPLLAPYFHVIAPDEPGFGNSEVPSPEKFTPTFDAVAAVTEKMLQQLGTTSFVLYMQDFGGPVGMRVATDHPEWIKGLIIQNVPISEDAWTPERLKAVRASAGGVTPEKRAAALTHVTVETDIAMYHNGARNPAALDPDAWTNDAYALGNPGTRQIMADLLVDLPSNLGLYPKWHAYLQKAQPETLVAWGKNDGSFLLAGANIVKRYVPKAEVHIYDTGHFALEEDGPDIANRISAKFAK